MRVGLLNTYAKERERGVVVAISLGTFVLGLFFVRSPCRYPGSQDRRVRFPPRLLEPSDTGENYIGFLFDAEHELTECFSDLVGDVRLSLTVMCGVCGFEEQDRDFPSCFSAVVREVWPPRFGQFPAR
jgi:hypothetical protein